MITALALFTVLPVRARPALTRDAATAALRWLPVVGLAVGALAALPLTATRAWAPHATLLGTALTLVALALLTRGLHLDGLADTADGLGAHATPERALEIMHRSDIGPFGVLAIVLVLAVDGAALVALDGGAWRPVAALAVAAATGRLAVVHASHRRIPAALPTGFGAYVAGSANTGLLVLGTGAVLGLGVGLAAATDASLLAWPLSQVGALALAAAFRWHVSRRIGGVSGDVFGALVELATAATLVGIALG